MIKNDDYDYYYFHQPSCQVLISTLPSLFSTPKPRPIPLMVIALSIIPLKGSNTASRIWPHSGYLGLTPVSVSGIVRTKLDPDAPSSSFCHAASAITISLTCYESRLARIGTTRTNVLYEQKLVLWTASSWPPPMACSTLNARGKSPTSGGGLISNG